MLQVRSLFSDFLSYPFGHWRPSVGQSGLIVAPHWGSLERAGCTWALEGTGVWHCDPLLSGLGSPPCVGYDPVPSVPWINAGSRRCLNSVDGGGIRGDPHIAFAHGGRADFRGGERKLFNFLSVPGLAVNVRTEESIFKLHDARLTVNGTYITELHVCALVGGSKRKWANASFWASELNQENWGWRLINGTCGGQRFKLGKGGFKKCEELAVEVDMASATFSLRDWTITARGNHVMTRVSGPKHRIDVTFTASGEAVARDQPHGVIGQSFRSATPRNGKARARCVHHAAIPAPNRALLLMRIGGCVPCRRELHHQRDGGRRNRGHRRHVRGHVAVHYLVCVFALRRRVAGGPRLATCKPRSGGWCCGINTWAWARLPAGLARCLLS